MLVISNRPRASRWSDFEITSATTPQIVLHLVQLLLLIIYMKKLLESDWLRAVQFKCNTPVQKV